MQFLSHSQRQFCVMALLSLVVSVEFLENIMFVFSASYIIKGVDADPRSFALAQGAYAVGSMLMIVSQQWLAGQFGYRRYLTAALAIFIGGTLLAATSTELTQLVTARFTQGLGGGALFTSGRVLIPIMFTPADRPRAQRIFMIGIFTATAMAPALAAQLLKYGVWQDVFIGVLPFAVIAAIGTWLLLPDAEPHDKLQRPALIPLLWFGVAIVALQMSMTEARFDIFLHPFRLAAVAVTGAVLFIGFLHHQWRHHKPLLQLRSLQNPMYLTGLAMYFMYYLISYLSAYLFPIYAAHGLEIQLGTVGWLNTMAGTVSLIGILIYLQFASRLQRKKPLIIAGLLIMAGAAWSFSSMPPGVSTYLLIPALAAKGLFGVLVVIPIAGLTFRGLSDDTFPHGYQSKNLMRQIASSFASALGAVLLQNRQIGIHASLATNALGDPDSATQWMHGAPGELAALIQHQALLMASEDMYRLVAVLSIVVALIILAQRRIA